MTVGRTLPVSSASERVDVAPSTPRSHALGRGLWVVVGVLLLAGAVLRMQHADAPMLDFFPTRQYMSVDLAWKYDMAMGGAGDPEDRRAAEIRQETEPPVTEVITAVVWRAMGERPLWVPRLLSVLIWSGGGVALALLLRRLGSTAVGVVSGVLVWTFTPFVVQASRAFQPDPLMIASIVVAVLALVVADEDRSTRSLVIAGLVSGFAVFVKVPALFFVFAVFVALTWRRGRVRSLWSSRTLLYLCLTLPAAVAFNVLGLWVVGYLNGKEGNFVFPRLLVTSGFWTSWMSLVVVTFGTFLVLLAGLGILTARGRARVVGAALVAGYLLYGVVFTWNYSTHHYYHLPLVLPIALGVGFLASTIEGRIRRSRGDLVSVGLATAATIALASAWMFTPWRLVPQEPNAAAVERNVTVSQEVGISTGHTDRALTLAPHYGYPLAFYGSVKGTAWPWADDLVFEEKRGDDPVTVEERFAELAELADAELFVVTDLDEWERQPELQELLRSRFRVYAEGPGYLVFDLR